MVLPSGTLTELCKITISNRNINYKMVCKLWHTHLWNVGLNEICTTKLLYTFKDHSRRLRCTRQQWPILQYVFRCMLGQQKILITCKGPQSQQILYITGSNATHLLQLNATDPNPLCHSLQSFSFPCDQRVALQCSQKPMAA